MCVCIYIYTHTHIYIYLRNRSNSILSTTSVTSIMSVCVCIYSDNGSNRIWNSTYLCTLHQVLAMNLHLSEVFKYWGIYSCGENSVPKVRVVIGRTRTKIYCRGTVCRRRVLAAVRTVRLGVTEVGNQAEPLKYSGTFRSSLTLWRLQTTIVVVPHR